MKTGKWAIAFFSGMMFLGTTSCKKCHACHYDAVGGTEVELGEYCGDDLETIESEGYHDHVADTTYEVHCHEH